MKHSPSGNHIRDAAAQELENTDPETLSSWILTQQHLRAPEAKGNLTQLLTAIAVGCKFVASAVRKVMNMACMLLCPVVFAVSLQIPLPFSCFYSDNQQRRRAAACH